MELAQLRDLFIVIYAAFGIVAMVVIVTLAVILFRKVTPIIDSARGTLNEIRGTSSFMSNTVVKPIVKVAGFAVGARKAIKVMLRLSGRKGGKPGEQGS